MIDVIVQSSTVGLFHALGVAVAPMKSRSASAPPWTLDWAGYADFEASRMHGSLALTMPAELCRNLRFGGVRIVSTSELLCELTQQLLGRIQRRLQELGVALRSGSPSVIDRPTLVRRTAGVSVTLYPFRALRGEIAVTLHGQLDTTALVYSGGVQSS